jgi:ABC-type siderophore export system fused ATPase/permease subunit
VVVVTHDDRYFHIADRVLGMDYGQLKAISRTGKPAKPRRRRSSAAQPAIEEA